MRNDNFFKISLRVFIGANVLLIVGVMMGIVWARPAIETTKGIVETIMAVSGAIIGFLVIYLSISFETIRKGYGRYALRVFRQDLSIWSAGGIFSLVILVGLVYLIYSDQQGIFVILLFNLSCLWFMLGVAFVFPYGNAILYKSSSGTLIERMIDQLVEADFKLSPPRNAFPATIYWAITETEDNRVDILSNILYHNINEGNSKIATQIILKLFSKIEKIPQKMVGAEAEKIVFRYLDIMQTAFDIANAKRDNVVIKVVLASLTSCSEFIAGQRWGRTYIEKLFDGIIHISKAFIEGENEDLLSDALWTYYHMAKYQISNNLPAETETWVKTEEGHMRIDSDQGWENDRKFEAIDKPMTHNLSMLVDRTFGGSNRYIVEKSVDMISTFAEMIIFDHQMGPIQKDRIGSMLAYQSVEKIKRFVGYEGVSQFGYLNLYIADANIMTALPENSRFSKAVFDYLISLMDFLIEEESIVKYDVEELGGLGRMIVGQSAKIRDAGTYLQSLVSLQKRVKEYLMRKVKDDWRKKSAEKEMTEIIVMIQNDIKSYKDVYNNWSVNNPALKVLIDTFQE